MAVDHLKQARASPALSSSAVNLDSSAEPHAQSPASPGPSVDSCHKIPELELVSKGIIGDFPSPAACDHGHSPKSSAGLPARATFEKYPLLIIEPEFTKPMQFTQLPQSPATDSRSISTVLDSHSIATNLQVQGHGTQRPPYALVDASSSRSTPLPSSRPGLSGSQVATSPAPSPTLSESPFSLLPVAGPGSPGHRLDQALPRPRRPLLHRGESLQLVTTRAGALIQTQGEPAARAPVGVAEADDSQT